MLRLGMGIWYGDFGEAAWDGHKYVCEDDFTEDEDCLVYTFGVSDDASFEETLASIGNQFNLIVICKKVTKILLQDVKCMHMITL